MTNNEYYKKRFVAKKTIEPIIRDIPAMHKSGIYIFERTDTNEIEWFYVGQAIDIYERTLSHYISFAQRIDISLKSRKFKSDTNPNGWTFKILEFCDKDKLNERENFYILKYMKLGKQSYNTTFGSQGEGKETAREYKESKGYRQGIANGYEKARADVKKLFDKYLTYAVTENTNKIKQRAYDKFTAFLNDK